MPNGSRVFVDVDTQRDFLEPAGALFIAGSERIRAQLAALGEYARREGVPILATSCSHTPEDPELEVFPPHCLRGTPGRIRIAETAWEGSRGVVVGVEGRFDDPETLPSHLTIEKRDYDVFRHPEASRIVARYNRDRPEFVVYGVATDYCVKAAVLGLLDRGCRVAVVVDAIHSIDETVEEGILKEFVDRGAVLTLTDAVRAGGNLTSPS